MDGWQKPSSPFLYPIVDTGVCRDHGRDPRDVAAACLRGGAPWLQLRGKRESGAAFLALADAIVASAREFDAAVIVNDRADIALMSGAAGAHVGQEDLLVGAVRRILGDSALVGLSTHDERQVDAAFESRSDYVAVGPIYGTATKDTGYEARGLDLVRYAAGRGRPVVAIGGINLARAYEVAAAGASGLAVISDLLVDHTEERVREYLRALA